MTTPLVSLLVAVYKTEKYLEMCLDSLINQTLSNIEIIIVNDGSPDNSQEIIDRYVQKDHRVRCIRQENKGLGATRNVGIDAARGEFIAFIDSDDWVEPDYCLRMYEEAIKTNADVVITDYYIDINIGIARKTYQANATEKYNSSNKNQYISDILQGRVSGFSWNKLYKLSFINKNALRFPLRGELENVEDQYFSIRSIFLASNISFVHQPLYHYNVRELSIVQTYQKNLFKDGLRLYELNCDFFKEHQCYKEWERDLSISLVNHCFISILNEGKNGNSNRVIDRFRCITDICFNQKLQKILKKISLEEYDFKKKLLLLFVKHKFVFMTLVYGTIYQRIIEYKMKRM